MNIIVACEETQAVTIELRKLGHEAYSCDLLECSGGHPEWHIQEDAIKIVYGDIWDMLIGYPPCTRLANSVWWYIKKHNLYHEVEKAAEFFNLLFNAPIEKICLENSIQNKEARKYIRKQDQIIQPYNFGNDASKATCLWLKNLPKLQNTSYVEPRIVDGKKRWSNQTDGGWNKLSPSPDRGRLKGMTYPGIAKAKAEQWTRDIK